MRLQLAHFVNRQRVCRVVTLRPSSLPVAKFQIGYLDSILLVDFDICGMYLLPREMTKFRTPNHDLGKFILEFFCGLRSVGVSV